MILKSNVPSDKDRLTQNWHRSSHFRLAFPHAWKKPQFSNTQKSPQKPGNKLCDARMARFQKFAAGRKTKTTLRAVLINNHLPGKYVAKHATRLFSSQIREKKLLLLNLRSWNEISFLSRSGSVVSLRVLFPGLPPLENTFLSFFLSRDFLLFPTLVWQGKGFPQSKHAGCHCTQHVYGTHSFL